MKFNQLNAVVVGYFLVNWALILNFFDGDKFGMLCAVVSMSACYVLENVRGVGVTQCWQWLLANGLAIIMVIAVFVSYWAWYF